MSAPGYRSQFRRSFAVLRGLLHDQLFNPGFSGGIGRVPAGS
jgi:hypothetical protein